MELTPNRRNLGVRLSRGHAGTGSPDDGEHSRVPVLSRCLGGPERARRYGHVDVVGTGILWDRGKYSNNRVDLVIHLEGAPYDGGVPTQLVAPEIVGEDQHRSGSVLILARTEGASE